MLDTATQEKIQLINDELSRLIPEKDTAHNQLFQAARYSLLGNGKRIRPLLTLATAEALGGDLEAALIPACALEMIHTYSLIHDDLPCMDDDDFRRGRLTLHKQYSAGLATLTGDFLLTYAFQIIAESSNLNPSQKIEIIKVLSIKSGGDAGMIAGQVLDIEAENKTLDLESLKNIHLKKTGALLCASIELGAISASADESSSLILRQFGEEIGLAFQIIDDILDVTSSIAKHGKTKSSDEARGKSTYASLLGVAKSKELANQLYNSSVEKLKGLNLEASPLKGLAEMIVCRNF